MAPAINNTSGLDFLSGGGQMGAAMRTHDWSATPLGAPESWPQPLKTLVGVMLAADQPMFVAWGQERVFLYNDLYVPMLPDQDRAALGRALLDVWEDASAELSPLVEQVFAGEPVHMADIELHFDRPGRPREAHFAFSYTPVRDEAGSVVGLFCPCTETTEQVLAERRRLAEAERQRTIFQQMPGFVAVLTSPEHVFEYVNDAYVALVGCREFVGRDVRDVFPELEDQGFFELLDQVYATGEPFSARALPINLSGEVRPRFVDLLYQPVLDEAGAVSGIFVGGYDITERVRAEQSREALLRLDDRLRDVSDVAALPVVASELLGELLGAARVGYGTIDPAAETITVWPHWSTPGFASLAGTLNFRDYGVYLEDIRRGKAVSVSDVRVDARTASKLEAFDAIGVRAFLDVPVVEAGRTVAQFFVHSAVPRAWTDEETSFVRDFAERTRVAIARREAEQRLRNSEARLATALASARLGTFDWDTGTGQVELDATARSIFGLAADDSVHQHDVFGRVAPDQLRQLRAAVDGAAAAGERLMFDCDIVMSGGETRHIKTAAVPVAYARGTRMVGVFQDATESKANERALVALTETLESRVLERTAALEAAHDQLRQSQKMEAVGQLTGGLAHDFNNLLAGVSGSLELISMRMAQGRTADVEKYVIAAKGAAERAAALTHRLLAFSRRQTLAPKPTDVKQLVVGMEDLIRRTTGPQITLETVNTVGLWPSLIDPGQLENAILNLCINARDAMPDGGRITIETANRWLDRRTAQERGLEPGQYISLCVSDTGTGMTPDVIEKAFDPFFTTKPIGLGTGLGLSMIYGFANQSGGAVSIYSEQGQGTNVCIYLPRHLGEAETLDGAGESAEIPRGHGETVLVIDDEPTVRMLVTEVLADLGYTAIEAEDGAAGLKVLNSDARIDLLVTDVGLPGGMNGRQVADAARVVRPELNVLFITGYAENAVLSHGHLDPGMHVMTKPFNMEALATRLRELIESRANG
jgi:signal transduction histidine kinase/ActR/RegA family two-component response regulator